MNKKGFTLIELLGVIILIGIVAVITVPAIKGTIKESREELYERQVDFIIKGAKNWGTSNTDLLPESGSILVTIETLKKEGFLENKVIKNPNNNTEMKGCVVVTYNKTYNQYEYRYDENCDVFGTTLTELAIDNFKVTNADGTNPTVVEKPACLKDGTVCKPGTPVAIKISKSDIYRFYVLKDDESKVTLMMDRNLGDNVAWFGDYWSVSYGPTTALAALKERTNDWKIPEFTYTISGLAEDGLTKRYENKTITAKARLITYAELNELGCSSHDNSCPKWVYENLKETGDNKFGYWTTTTYASDYGSAWVAYYSGNMIHYTVDVAYNGVRPVIELSK